ncbi:ATP-dependent DNA helicase PcrA [Clostridium sartagoforme]|uniref:DNA 3'-5' helicase n=1 Tax=Clostridium sartagoforme TaxID=84031 RepID=A0A4S2DH56_9CLOT|nr:UvrD-helicase domain-containing protein [Clostridium sartagoforme]TGY40134.1 ATP-dependent DNA helicase PcrA [Clostridium sartagoforme]
MDLKKLLNKEQYDGATTVDGQVLILAGAGSGKTRVLTYRMAHMIEDLGILPYKILAITFTNKAAKEMKDRVKGLIGDRAEDMWISTFHSTCVRILRREIEKLGYKKSFTIYDSSDQKTLVKECIKALNINDKDISEQEIISKIGKAKDNMQSPAAFMRENESNFREKKIAEAYVLYQKRLKENNALDFDDLISKTVELFKKDKETLEFYQRKFQYIMVDEYQDTNKVQYEFIRLLADKHKNICVVGDDDQCLVEGTLIETEKGTVKIEDLKENDEVKVASGKGETKLLRINNISKREYSGTVIKIVTEDGDIIKATPNHIAFSRLTCDKNNFVVYLMHKEGVGYRVGKVTIDSSFEEDYTNILREEMLKEKADKLWVLKTCASLSDGIYYEELYSIKYGVPKFSFNASIVNGGVSEDRVNNLYNSINTFESAEKLMEERYLYSKYPHYITLENKKDNEERKNINVTFFGGEDKTSEGVYSHNIVVNSLNEESIAQKENQYDKAEDFSTKLSLEKNLDIIRKAKLTKENEFRLMPVGSLKVGMTIAIFKDGKIVEGKIVEKEREEYSGYVYDLNIEHARNYIANNVVVHNCIYQWRGADIRNILDFEKDYPNAKVIKLEQNYRSKGNILDAANVVIVNNANRKSKALRTEQEAGSKIKVYRAYSDADEGNFVAKQIRKIKDAEKKDYKDFAILYRTNAQSRIFEESLRRNDIPYKILGGTRFYDRKEIKDMLSYLKVLVNPNDSISLKRIINVPKRGIGEATVGKVSDFAESYELTLWDALSTVRNIPTLTPRNCGGIENFMEMMEKFIEMSEVLPVSNLIEMILKETGYISELEKSKEIEDKSRIENLKELVSDAVDFERSSEDTTLSAYLEKVSLVQDTDKLEDDADTIVLMTVHSAKGLEFPVVFMVGMENGIFPGMASFDSEAEMEESRRLCYVGITRAKEQLFMTSAEVRRQFGRTVAYAQSDFINEIKSDLKEYVSGESLASRTENRSSMFQARNNYNNPHSLRNSSNAMQKPKIQSTQSSVSSDEVTIGRKVKHSKFGIGTVVSITDAGSDKKVTIAFDNQGIKILLLSVANLELA